MTRFIKVPIRVRQELARRFQVTRVSVNKALSFKSNSERAGCIRAAAMAAGGVIMEPAMCEECSTEHTQDFIIQDFGNGVVLKLNKVNSTANIYVDNVLVDRATHVTMRMWSMLVERCENMAATR